MKMMTVFTWEENCSVVVEWNVEAPLALRAKDGAKNVIFQLNEQCAGREGYDLTKAKVDGFGSVILVQGVFAGSKKKGFLAYSMEDDAEARQFVRSRSDAQLIP